MATGVVYDVTPQSGVWMVRMKGDSQSECYGTKAEATTRAAELARRHETASVRVLADNGTVEREETYRADASRSPSRR